MTRKSITNTTPSAGEGENRAGIPFTFRLFCLLIVLLLVPPVRGQDNICIHDYCVEKEPKRIALVIGNAHYANLSTVTSATVDADQISQRLGELGFEVERHDDVRTPFEFWEVIFPAFRQKLTTGDFIVFYFSGHGFSYGADSFLAPTELPLSMTVQHVTDHAIAVESFKSHLETHSPGLILFIIDACRSVGPLIDDTNGERTIAKGGPGEMEKGSTVVNTLIAYATKPGHVALGSTQPGQPSPFTEALVGNLTAEGKSFRSVFDKAAAELEASTTPPQVAGTFDWSRTDPYMRPTQQNLDAEREAWLTALSSALPRRVKVFVQLNSVSRYQMAAKKWIAENPENDLASGFTRASPIAIDRAWRPSNAEMVAIRRLSVPLAFTRSLSEDQRPALREVSDTEIGLVRSGTKINQIAELRTGEDFVAGISSGSEVHHEFYRNSLAYSLANIDAHGTMVATRPLLGRAQPQLTASVVEHIPAKAVLQVVDVTLGGGGGVWIQATGSGNSSPFFFKVEPGETPQVLELGHSLKEILAPPRLGSLPELVDPAPIKAAIAELKDQGWKVTWISLSTAPTADEAEQETRAARMANAEYILKHSDIPLFVSKGTNSDIGDRITSVAGREDLVGNSVRIRFFGIK